MKSGSYEDLDTRINNCPESVALFTDTQLADFLSKIQGNGVARRCVMAELMLRYWLYDGHKPKSLETAVAEVCAAIVPILSAAFQRVVLLRKQAWPVSQQAIEQAFCVGRLDPESEHLWGFLRQRVCSFMDCDGVIPAYIRGTEEAIAIPFTVERDHDEGQIVDREGNPIQGWIDETPAIWKTLGWQCCVRLRCDFGNYSALDGDGALFQGGSFALPLLLGLTRHDNDQMHPLAIVCTGEIRDGKLAEIAGRDAKQELARQIGSMFIAPGVGDVRFIPPDLDVKKALSEILTRFGEDRPAISSRLKRVFIDRDLGRFDEAIEQLTRHFSGRERKLQEVLEWVDQVECGENSHQRWIGGGAGCGKSAFIAKLTQESKEYGGWFVIPYFFDPKSNPHHSRRVEEFFDFAAKQIATEHGFRFENIESGEREQERRLRYALRRMREKQSERVVFLIDGVDEAEGGLDTLAIMALESPGCVWVIAGQEIPETESIRSIASILHDSLGELPPEDMIAMIKSSGVELSPELIAAVVKKADGMPQYTRWVLDELGDNRDLLDPNKLPEGMSGYYRHIIDRYFKGTTSKERWRADLIDILALLATAKHRVPLSAATVVAMLKRYRRGYSEEVMSAALRACKPILESVRSDDDSKPECWAISKNCFREYILKDNDGDLIEAITDARKIWSEVCRAWNTELEEGLRSYALRNIADELCQADQKGDFVVLAQEEKFIADQMNVLGPQFALETLKRAIDAALSVGTLADAAALTLKRADLVEKAYGESPFDAMRAKDDQWSQELIDRIENQNDRTLWYLALAVWHANGSRLGRSARVLDQAIPPAALREKLVGGASMCGGVLISLLTHIETRRFDWQRFLTRLDDLSKCEMVSLLVCHIRPPLDIVWRVLDSIREPRLQNDARKEVVRELARTNVQLAEMELSRFENEFEQAFAAVEIVAAYARMKRFDKLDRVMERYISPRAVRQTVKALAFKAAALKHAKKSVEGERALVDAYNIIESEFAGRPDQRAKCHAEVGHAQAEMGFTSIAREAFATAFEAVAEISANKHILRAICFKTIASNIATVIQRSALFATMLEDVVEGALYEISLSGDVKADPTRLLLLRALGKNGQLDTAAKVLHTIQDRKLHCEAVARLHAYYRRFREVKPREISDRKLDSDGKMMFHALAAIEKIKVSCADEQFPIAPLFEVCSCLRFSKGNWRARTWGPARILSEAGSVLFRHGDGRASHVFDTAERFLSKMPEYEQGRYFVELAIRRSECGDHESARRLLVRARGCLTKMHEKSKVDLHAEIERAEIACGYAKEHDFAFAGVLTDINLIGNQPNTIIHKLQLYCSLVAPFAAAGRGGALQEICAFSLERVQDNRFLKLPEQKSAEQRSALAAEFCGKLAKAAIDEMSKRSPANATIERLCGWITKFVEVCEQARAQNRIALPAGAIRACALLRLAVADFDGAVASAKVIAVGETRSVILRELAKWAVHKDRCGDAAHLFTQITHKRSEHLPDIGREIANRGEQNEASHLHRLVVLCSEYPDGAYRMIESLIRFHKPDAGSLIATLTACGVWDAAPDDTK